MVFNSTIRQKVGKCEVCGKRGPLTKRLCQGCYWQSIKLKSVNKMAAKDAPLEDDLQDLIVDADAVYSRWLRLSQADKSGNVVCFTCDSVLRWQDAQCGHYVKRGNLFLRWDRRNTEIQDAKCNVYREGHYSEFTRRLEKKSPGLPEILMEEGHLVYKPTREEIRAIISEYTQKLKNLK